MSELTKLKELVHDVVDQGTTTVEHVHKTVAAVPFEILEQLEALSESARAAKEVHAQAISVVYDAIRRINDRVGQLADELLQPPA